MPYLLLLHLIIFQVDELINVIPLITAAASTTINVNWKDRSGCAAHLTSITLKIYEDGLMNSEPISSFVIPRHCLTDRLGNFSLVLPSSNSCLPDDWKPLNQCQKYTLELESEYWSRWKGPPSSFDIFTTSTGS